MKIKGSVISLGAVVLAGFLLIAALAVGQAGAQSFKDQTLGVWHLVSVEIEENRPYGDHPKGLLYLGVNGEFSVVAIGEGTAQKTAYFGTYIADEADHSLTFHVTATTAATGEGQDYKWFVSFNGDEMTQNLASPTGGRSLVSAVWKR
jgi:hypothetical protein